MSSAPINLPGIISWRRHAKNGLNPEDKYYQLTDAALNHSIAYRRKPVFQKTCKLGQVGGASGIVWRWYCRTGYGAQRLAVLVVLGFDDRVLAVQPYATVAITKVGGATTTLEFHGGASSIPSVDAPEQWMPQWQAVDVDANAYYTGAVELFDNARVISVLVYEDSTPTIDGANPYMSEWTPNAGSPIFDADVGNQIAAVGAMHRKNGGLRVDWSMADGTARTRTSATPANLIDGATTGNPTAATLGYTLVTSYRNTVSATTIPVTMAVYGSIAAGSGVVRFRDTSGADAVTVTVNNATPQWFTGTGAVSVGTGQKYDFMFDGDGVNSLSVKSVSLFEEG